MKKSHCADETTEAVRILKILNSSFFPLSLSFLVLPPFPPSPSLASPPSSHTFFLFVGGGFSIGDWMDDILQGRQTFYFWVTRLLWHLWILWIWYRKISPSAHLTPGVKKYRFTSMTHILTLDIKVWVSRSPVLLPLFWVLQKPWQYLPGGNKKRWISLSGTLVFCKHPLDVYI